MPWFKVDDKLHNHRKTRRLRRMDPQKNRDAAPFGIWSLAGSWCGDNRTGGFVPLEVLLEWDDDAEVYAERLVEAGLWWHDRQDDEDGYRFHDWSDRNPSPEGIPDPSTAGALGNHIRWHERRGIVDPDCEICSPDRGDDRGDVGGDVAPDSGANREPVPVPVPDPTQEPCASAAAEREFEQWYAAYPRKRGRGQAVRAYKAARKKVSAEELLAAVARQRPALLARGADYCPYPATWLNGERWADQPDSLLPATPAAGTSRQQADAEMFARMAQRAEVREAAARGEIA